ncbi:FUSC family protein [Streptomyces sp. NBS 14/10]|uniref:FUSC family protein n=1 Tax=Streptomyces sp. NBS 14/10 TaxID=1945643 RepID=UPI0015C5B3D5|nr:FUSC family protein [Streptomyces sp. NBS 14/10]KAK1184517.1 FUSC family protein [Streptomyces sp. NBS 14/10]
MGVSLPLAVGLAAGQVVTGVVSAIGALWAATFDDSNAIRPRTTRIGVFAVATPLGVVVGQAAYRGGSFLILVATILLLTAVCIGLSRSPRGELVGIQVLLGGVVGAGLPLPGPWWLGGALLFAGGVLILLLSAFPMLVQPFAFECHQIRRLAVQLGDALATPAAPGNRLPAGMLRARVSVIDQLQVLRRPAFQKRAEARRQKLLTAAETLDDMVDVTASALHRGIRIPPSVQSLPAAVAGLATTTRAAADPEAQESVTAWEIGRLRDLAAHGADRRVIPSPGTSRRWGERPHRSAVILPVCVAAAFTVATFLHEPRAYWLGLMVGFIYKPDAGPLVGRAFNRCAGTLLGTAVSLLLEPVIGVPWVIVLVAAACGAGIALVVHHYALSTMSLTVLALVFVRLLGDEGPMPKVRAIDTLFASAIVVAAGLLLARESWHVRARRAVSDAARASYAYSRALTTGEGLDLTRARRRYLQSVHSAQSALRHARLEPPFRTDPRLMRVLHEAEDLYETSTRASLSAQNAALEASPRKRLDSTTV